MGFGFVFFLILAIPVVMYGGGFLLNTVIEFFDQLFKGKKGTWDWVWDWVIVGLLGLVLIGLCSLFLLRRGIP